MSSNLSLPNLLQADQPILMGIVNLTPDSFYDGGYSLSELKEQIADFESASVDIIDLGAESSRPGATPITFDEEIERLSPALDYIKAHSNAFISDTTLE